MGTVLVRPSGPASGPSNDRRGAVEVTPLPGDTTYVTKIRGHRVVFDQPRCAGGEDRGPSPVEVFVAGLTACVAHYAGSYLVRHGVCREGLRVIGEYAMAPDRPERISAVSVRVVVPETLPADRRAALLAVASHCSVHNTLQDPPTIDIALAEER